MSHFENPDMMVIGDSLAQGCRSLSVTSLLCSQSWSARVAAVQKWQFVPPNHPRPVLFDLEREIRNLNPVSLPLDNIVLEGFVGRYLKNLDDWQHQIPQTTVYFDNLALAGALVGDLYNRSAKSCDDSIKTLVGDNPFDALKISSVGELHIAINGRYVLNPSKDPAYDNYTQLDWVALRKPKNLFVQIGHNHGLFAVGFSGSICNINNPEDSITQPGAGQTDNFWDQWQILATRLANLSSEVERIYIVLLPKVGAVGNLMPLGNGRDADGYAPAYDPTFSTHPRLPGPQLKQIDTAIKSVNAKIKDIILTEQAKAKAAARTIFIDAYQILNTYDFKNSEDNSQRIPITGNEIVDNRYLNGHLRFGWPPIPNEELCSGGFFSVDGMHPSGVGYAVIAQNILKPLGATAIPADILAQAYNDDSLLSDYPAELDMLVDLLKVLREAISVGHFDHTPVGPISDDWHFADLLRVLKGVFIK